MAYTNIDDPSAYFQTALYTGNAGNQTITNDGNSDLQPDFVWLKSRTFTSVHLAQDSTRGATGGVYRYLQPDNTAAEAVQTDGDGITSLNSDGFSLGFNNSNSWNQSGNTYVAWQWKANGGTTSSNTDGDITSTVQVNQDAGFSIVTDSPTNTTARSIGHGLGVAPQVVIRRARNRVESWRVFHSAAGSTGSLKLNDTSVYNSSTTLFTGVTSSTFGVGTDFSVNGNYNYVSYCFAEKQGYSKFGSYKGNGNADGTFVYTGFKPAFVLAKNYSNSGYDWRLVDSARNTFNLTDLLLMPNNTSAEFDGSTHAQNIGIDFLSNGFKCRSGQGAFNFNGGSYIYMAFAENPFVTSTGIPTTAR